MGKQFLVLSFIFALGFIFTNCEEEKPEPLPFEEEKIIGILIDVHLAEAAIQSLGKVMKDSMSSVYYDQICTIHDISRPEFDSLLIMLRDRPDDLKNLYEKMLERIEIMEKEFEAKKEEDTPGIDSTDLIKLNSQNINK
jgi:hypothetical protein